MTVKLCKEGLKLSIILDDITNFNGDAIVNPANTLMIMGGGVAGAIKRKGGQEIEDEAKRYAPIPIGKAIITKAGKLKCKYIIHAPTVEYPGSSSSFENVIKATKASIEIAIQNNLKSLAFPLMGAGVGGLSIEKSLEAMIKVFEEFKNINLDLHIYIIDEKTYSKVINFLKSIGWIEC